MRHLLISGMILLLLSAFAGCSNLINDMGNQLGPDDIPTGSKDTPQPVPLTLEETAQVLDDFLSLQINDTEGALDITFQTKIDQPDVIITSKNPCIIITGETEVDYVGGEANWTSHLQLQAVACQPADDPEILLDGNLDLYLKGPFGSVGTYNLVGSFTTADPLEGPVITDLTFSVADCIFKWDCWSGEANGFEMGDLKEFLSI